MGKHAQPARVTRRRPGRVSRRRYPVLAAGAVLAVVGASALLLGGGVPGTALPVPGGAYGTTALAGGEAPAAASSSGSAVHGCVKPGSRSSVSATGAAGCPSWAFGGTWQLQLTQPTATAHSAATPADTSAGASASSANGPGQFFGLAPVGTPLPRSDAYCASRVRPMAENVPANATANHVIPPAGTDFHWGPFVTGNAGVAANFAHVDGNFSGTTGEILEWAACKWGWNQDYAMAEAVRESSWQQSEVSDNGHSFGILQVRVSRAYDPVPANSGWGGYPWVGQSTALDADAQMAYLRACYDGDTSYFGNGYQAGDAWGCIGSWFSGDWLSGEADGYIGRVQAVLSSQGWLKL